MHKEKILNELKLARAYCANHLIWFAPALYACEIHLTKQVQLTAIDLDYNIYFNPDAILQIQSESNDMTNSIAKLGFLWIHEISHILREHAARASDIDAKQKTWNMAADLEINDSVWKNLVPPNSFPVLSPQKFQLPSGELAEWYYHQLINDDQLQSKCKNYCNKGGNGKHKEDSPEQADNSKNENKPDGSEHRDKLPEWDEGSGVHNLPCEWEQQSQKKKMHPIDKDIIRRKVAEKMRLHKKQIGNSAGGWTRWMEETLQSRTNWKRILHHRMSSAIATGIGLRVDYSFARPSRRQSVYHPIITPSFTGSRSGRIAVIVDTSGSMSIEIVQAIGEVCKVLEEFKLPVTVIPCDARAYEPIVLNRPSDRFKLQTLKGGGGTNMIVGIEAALALKPKVDSILVLTDGHTPYPPKPYKTPVIFGIIKKYKNQNPPLPPTPPWSKSAVVNIEIKK